MVDFPDPEAEKDRRRLEVSEEQRKTSWASWTNLQPKRPPGRDETRRVSISVSRQNGLRAHLSLRNCKRHVVQTLLVQPRRESERDVSKFDLQSLSVVAFLLRRREGGDTSGVSMIDPRSSIDLHPDTILRPEAVVETGDVRTERKERH